MKKAKYILLFFCLITLREGFSQCLLFNEIKSASNYNSYYKVIETENNYYMVGIAVEDTDEFIAPLTYISKCVVVKTDKCGNVVWKRFLGLDYAYESGLNIIKIGDFLYVLGGTQEGARASTNFIAKLDEEGTTVWYKIYRNNNDDITCNQMFVENNKIVIYGGREKKSITGPIMYAYAIDFNGKILWSKDYLINNPSTYFYRIFKINSAYLGISFTDDTLSLGKDSNRYNTGVLICKLDSQLNLLKVDTLKSGFFSGVNLTAYNPQLKQVILYLKHYVSSDSSICQIAFLDSTGKVEKIIDDPYNFLPNVVIPYRDGWLRNTNSMIIFYDSGFTELKKIQYKTYDTGYFESSYITVVRNETAFLVAGKCRACNPYDFNPNVRYDRPTAIMVDSNFIDYGKAQPPYEAPKPFAAIKAFPNPALESITLQITETAAEYVIYNSMGMFVSAGSMASSADISLLNMASGMYIIQLKTPLGNHIGNVKFLKK